MSLSYLTIAPLGTRLDGRLIWPFMGAAPDGDGDGGAGGDGGEGDGDGGDDGDGNEPDPESTEGLKKALERERETNKQKSRELRGFKTLMKDTGVKTFDEFKGKVTGTKGTGTGSGNGQQQQDSVDIEAIKQAARDEAKAEANAAAAKSITESKIEALATKGFVTPRDAVLALRDDLEDLITDDGKPDVPAINRALAGLLKDRPHWKKDSTGATDYDGGTRQTAPATTGFSAQLRQESQQKRFGSRK